MRAAIAFLLVLLTTPAFAAEVHPFGTDGWQRITAAHAGRKLLVHFWSLTCAPCMAEMPRWAGLVGRSDVDLVLVSTDSIDEAPRLNAALKRAGLGKAENWAFAGSFPEKLRFTVDRQWRGELPMTRAVVPGGKADTILGGLETESLQTFLSLNQKP